MGDSAETGDGGAGAGDDNDAGEGGDDRDEACNLVSCGDSGTVGSWNVVTELGPGVDSGDVL